MEDLFIKATLATQQADLAMIESRFFDVSEKYQEASNMFRQAIPFATTIQNREHLENFAATYARKANEAETYLQMSQMHSHDYTVSTNAEDSDSDISPLLNLKTPPNTPKTNTVLVQTANQDMTTSPPNSAAPVQRPRTGSANSAGKSPLINEERPWQLSAQLDKRASTNPLTALMVGFQTIRDMILGPAKPSFGPSSTANTSLISQLANGSNANGPSGSPSNSKANPSLTESFLFSPNSSMTPEERQIYLQKELSRVQGEFQKIQSLLDRLLNDQKRNSNPFGISSNNDDNTFVSTLFNTSSINTTMLSSRNITSEDLMSVQNFSKEAFMKQALRENYISSSSKSSLVVGNTPTVQTPGQTMTASGIHVYDPMPTSVQNLQQEVRRLRVLLTNSERKNEEWNIKWQQVKAKALKKSKSTDANSSSSPHRPSESMMTNSSSPSAYSYPPNNGSFKYSNYIPNSPSPSALPH